MKELYEHPMIMVEEFTVNRAIAACGDETGRDIIFDCMIGPNRDLTNVLTDSCIRKAGTTTATQAYAMNSSGHSNYTGGTWESNKGSCTYNAPNDAIGLLYFCSKGGQNCFKIENNVLKHTENHGPDFHVQIAPLYGTAIEEVNVGS